MSNLAPLSSYEIVEPGVELVTNRAGQYLLRRIDARLTDDERLLLNSMPRVEDAICFLQERAISTANATFTPPGFPSYLCLKKIREVEGGALSMLLIGQEPERFVPRVIENIVRVIFPDVSYAEFMERVQAAIAAIQSPGLEGWLPVTPELALPVDRSVQALARYNAGLLVPVKKEGMELQELPVPCGRFKQVQRLAVGSRPHDVVPELNGAPLAPYQGEPSEVKAKVLLASLAFAARSASSSRFLVRLKDLMEVVGYGMGSKANGRTYWEKAATVIRAIAIDLPSQVIHVRYVPPGAKKPLFLEEYLMRRPRLLSGKRAFPEGFVRAIWDAHARGGDAAVVEVIREAEIEGFELGFAPAILDAFGFGHHALERVPRALLGLKGRAFWLGYDIAFLRRWSGQSSPCNGRLLAEELEAHGYFGCFSRNRAGKVRVKDALKDWWNDVGKLVEIGLLENSGVRLYRNVNSRWCHVSDAISALISPEPGGDTPGSGGRIHRELLEQIHVVYEVPSSREEAIASARKKHQQLKASSQRARAASEGRKRVS